MPRFTWHGPPTAQTFTADGQAVDVMLAPGVEVTLPETALTACLLASGKLVRLEDVQKPSRKAVPQEEATNDQ